MIGVSIILYKPSPEILIYLDIFINELSHKYRNNPIFAAEIAREANLEILNEVSAWEFCSEKISSYLDSLSSASNEN